MAQPYVPRFVDETLRDLLQSVPIVVIDGARATGKTTTARQHATSEIRLPRDLDRLLADPRATLTDGGAPLLVDEWQLAGTDVLWTMKELVDEDPRPGRFILTGSVEPESYGPTYPLTGRSARVTLAPMTRQELHGRAQEATWLSRLWAGELYRSGGDHAEFALDQLVRTGFPGAPVDRPGPWLRSYAQTVAERSIDERRDPERVGVLLQVLAELESQALPDERIWTASQINRVTYRAYDSMLRRAHVVTGSPPWESNRLKRLTGYRKRHLVDHALALAVARLDADALKADPGLAGRYLESFVATQLRPDAALHQALISHLRTAGGDHEVDLLVTRGQSVSAFEVKAGVNPRPDDAKHLLWLRDKIGDQLDHAVVLHRGGQCFELIDGIWAIPLSTFS